ncbi:MAG TPA: Ku protein [Stellaceae bacterium]|nr:Ku protein [Stellaceae bacterium]
MAPRTAWRGLLTLARLTCPVRLHSAVVRADRLGFQALNRATLNRLQMRPHDPQTGKEVTRDFVVRGYEVEPGNFVMIEDRDLVELQIDSSRVLVLERFLDRAALDTAYFDTPYFLVPDGRAADLAFGVIRDAIQRQRRVGVTRIVLGSRERAAIIEQRGNGMLLTTLRAAHEVRGDDPYFGEIDDRPADAAMVDMAERLMARLPGAFDPRRDFRDRYQEALFHFVQAKRKGEKPVLPKPREPAPLQDVRDALESSIAALGESRPAAAIRQRAPTRRDARSPVRAKS